MGTVRWPRARRVLPGGSAAGYAASVAVAAAAPRAWLIAEPDFWRLWLVGLVVFGVRWLEMLAVAVFAYQRTGSPFVVAMLTMLRMLPMALFGAVIGAAGRTDRTAHRADPGRPVDGADLADPGAARLCRRARGVATRARQLFERHRLDHRQPGAAHDDRRGGRAGTDERGDVDRCRLQQCEPGPRPHGRRRAARDLRHRRRVQRQRPVLPGRASLRPRGCAIATCQARPARRACWRG